jgi:hypothetical protein
MDTENLAAGANFKNNYHG